MKGNKQRILMTIAFAALAFAACGDKSKDEGPGVTSDDKRLDASGNVREGRDLTSAELDTLLAIKKRVGITRDEYWDDWGGIVANDWAEFRYPPGKLTVGFALHAFDAMERARRYGTEVFGASPAARLTVRCSASMENYRSETKRDWWHYGALDKNTLVLQPVAVLMQRGLMGVAPAREYYRWVIRSISGGRAPRWIEYGVASVVAREDDILTAQTSEFGDLAAPHEQKKINGGLEQTNDRLRFRRAHYAAFRMARRITARRGIAGVVAFLRDVGSGSSFDAASRSAFGRPWEEVVRDASQWNAGEEE